MTKSQPDNIDSFESDLQSISLEGLKIRALAEANQYDIELRRWALYRAFEHEKDSWMPEVTIELAGKYYSFLIGRSQ